MKIKVLVAAILLTIVTDFNTTAIAHTPTKKIALSKTAQTEKVNNIKKFLKISGATTQYRLAVTQMLGLMKTQYPQVPPKFWNTFQAELKPEEAMNQMIPIYSKYYTNQEIKQMIAFYQTPLGKKMVTVLPKVSRESSAIGQRYGAQAAKRALQKLVAQGYIRRRSSQESGVRRLHTKAKLTSTSSSGS